MRQGEFKRELRLRLKENQLLTESDMIPEVMKDMVGILGWHFWIVNLSLSLFLSVGVILKWMEEIIKIVKIMFLW